MKQPAAKVVTLYGRPNCIPCESLEAMFAAHAITYRKVNIRELPEDELALVRAQISAITKAPDGTPTVPAVCITTDGVEHWFSNDGLMEVNGMFAEIMTALQE